MHKIVVINYDNARQFFDYWKYINIFNYQENYLKITQN